MKIKHIYQILCMSMLFGLAACTDDDMANERQRHAVIINNSEGALKGEILVKFRPEISEMLDQAQLRRSAGRGRITRLGVSGFDKQLSAIGTYELERIFPLNQGVEERTRKSGMHLWYLVRFDDTMNLDTVADKLSQLGELSKIEFNQQIKRTWNTKSTPLVQVKSRSLSSVNSQTGFNDPELGRQWNFINQGEAFMSGAVAGADVNCVEAWKKCTGDPSIIVAVMDEGVDWSHPDLAANMWINEKEIFRSNEDNDGNGYAGDYYGYNFSRNSGTISYDADGDTGHGTHIAGVIAGVNGNNQGICGIAGGDGTPNSGVKIMSLQIFSGNYGTSLMQQVKGIKYAADNGAVILQCSWGYISATANPIYYPSRGVGNDEEYEAANPLMREAFDYFIYNAGSPNGVIDGGIIVFASGNESAPSAAYPGAYKDYICVSAMSGDYSPTTYTNYGPGVDITAPGGENYRHQTEEGGILSTMPKFLGSYGYMEGTSMACPHVSGVAALGLSYATKLRKHFKADQYRKLLIESVKPIDPQLKGMKLYHYFWNLGVEHPSLVDVSTFRGKMGKGVTDAGILLTNIEQNGVGAKLTLPNVYVAVSKTQTVELARCFDNGEAATFQASAADASIAKVRVEGKRLIVEGLKEGATELTVTPSNGQPQKAVITVRANANSNGWL